MLKETGLLNPEMGIYRFLNDPLFTRECLEPFLKDIEPGSLVLDLACGVGMESRELEKIGMRVVPLDLDLGFLKLIQNNYPQRLDSNQFGLAARIAMAGISRKPVFRWVLDRTGLPLQARERRLLADAHFISLADESIDAVMCKHYLVFGDDSDRKIVLKEIDRVLKSGGKALIYNEERDEKLVEHPFNLAILRRLLADTNLRIEYTNTFPIPPFDRFNSRAGCFIKKNMAAFLRKVGN